MDKVRKSLFSLVMLCGLLTGISTPASAELILRDNPAVEGSHVTVGDLFLEAGDHAQMVLGLAPAPGAQAKYSVRELQSQLRQAGLVWNAPGYLKMVNVRREGVRITSDMVLDMLREKAHAAGYSGDYRFTLFGGLRNSYVATDFDPASLVIENFNASAQGGRFSATLRVPQPSGAVNETRINGRMEEVRMVPVLAHNITPGEIIEDASVEWKAVPANRIGRNVVQSIDTLIGKTVRRPLIPGRMIRETDIQTPIAVTKGAYVVMSYRIGGLALSASGRALENGGIGDIIRLMNPHSKQTIEGRVVSPDQVEVVRSAALFAARNTR